MRDAGGARGAVLVTATVWAAMLLSSTGCLGTSIACMALGPVPVALRFDPRPGGDLRVCVLASGHVRDTSVHAVDADGCVRFEVARSGLHCVQDYGWYSSSGDEPDDAPLLEVRHGDELVAALTPRQLAALPVDGDGCHRLSWAR